MMAVSPSSFFAFLLLVVAHLVILNFAAASEKYQPNCPESFNSSCGSTTRKIWCPFTNGTHPGCGLCTVNCSGEGPIIELVRGQGWYQLKEIQDEVIIINLRNLSSSRSCELFSYLFPLPTTPSISFNILHPPLPPFRSSLKCNSNSSSRSRGELDRQIVDYFHHLNYSQYQGCSPGFTVYYIYPPPIANEIPPTNPPNGCTAILLPTLPPTEKTNASDVFSILDVEDVDISIHWDASEQCRPCRNDNGQCSHDLQEFHCLKDGNWQF